MWKCCGLAYIRQPMESRLTAYISTDYLKMVDWLISDMNYLTGKFCGMSLSEKCIFLRLSAVFLSGESTVRRSVCMRYETTAWL
jgi:hypothetical protein